MCVAQLELAQVMQYMLVLEETGLLPEQYRSDVKYAQVRALVTRAGRANSQLVRPRRSTRGVTMEKLLVSQIQCTWHDHSDVSCTLCAGPSPLYLLGPSLIALCPSIAAVPPEKPS